jgi:hypothetical protein
VNCPNAAPPGTPCPPGTSSAGTVIVDCTLGPGADATLSFDATGVATGPYAGTFHETGTFILGPPGPFPNNYSAVLSVSSTFTIWSGTTTVTGSKSSTGVTQPTNINFCDDYLSEPPFDGAGAFANYTATIQTSQGLFADSCQASGPPNGTCSNPQAGGALPFLGILGGFWEPFFNPNPYATPVVVFAPGGGAFVIGDGVSANGTRVTFWGAQWWKDNPTSSGAKVASFKGFAENPSTPGCSATWSTDPGNSTPPPNGPLPDRMGVIVTSQYSKSGPQISGDIAHIVVVQTDPGYAPDPGHPGTGTVVQQIC